MMFPKIWALFFDEDVTAWVKLAYSAKPEWRNRPFSDHDVQFYFKGVAELSIEFTENRGDQFRSQPRYFEHPRFRSSYLLYFLPLQCAKFSALFQKKKFELRQSLSQAKKHNRPFAVYDMGSGPGTASLAFLIFLSDEIESKKLSIDDLPPIRMTWFDSNSAVLKDGVELFKRYLKRAEWPESLISLETHAATWANAGRVLDGRNSGTDADGARLLLFGNVLNESERKKNAAIAPLLNQWLKSPVDTHAVFVEPAAKSTSQMLSQLRDDLLESEGRSQKLRIIGPCLHTGRCPLAHGRDWCHFSDAAQVPGRWFLEFSKKLGSERKFLKYSLLWLATSKDTSPQNTEHKRLVLSDTMTSRSGDATYLICEPNEPRKIRYSSSKRLHRGDIVDLRSLQKGSPAGPLSGASGSKVGYVKKK